MKTNREFLKRAFETRNDTEKNVVFTNFEEDILDSSEYTDSIIYTKDFIYFGIQTTFGTIFFSIKRAPENINGVPPVITIGEYHVN